LDQVARGTSGFSGAQLANLVNEAALAGTKADRKAIEVQDFEFARDKLIVGAANKKMAISEKDKMWTAYHEVGHAMLNLLLPETDPFHKVTIIPHGQALGISWSLPEGDKYSQTKEQMLSRITVALGGMIAEDMQFAETTSGVSSDLKQATRIARAMVTNYGMSSLGPVLFNDHEVAAPSPDLAAKIDNEIMRIISECKVRGQGLLTENWKKVELLVKTLLEKETLHAADVYVLLGLKPRESHAFKPKSASDSVVSNEVELVLEKVVEDSKKSESDEE
jgi:cell division protease FtsH